MAKEIRLDQIGDHMKGQLETLLRVTVLEADKRVKESSPVDLGRFRASWQVGKNASGSTPKPAGKKYPNVPALTGYNYTPGTEELGNYYSIHNNLPYAEKLAIGRAGSGTAKETRYDPKRTVQNWRTPGGGSSHQTNGPGWIDVIAKDMQSYVKAEYERIKRQS